MSHRHLPVPKRWSPGSASSSAALIGHLGTERVDVADLGSAGALLRSRAARDDVIVLEREPDTFLRFREAAVRFWCDAGPVIRTAQNDVLAGLGCVRAPTTSCSPNERPRSCGTSTGSPTTCRGDPADLAPLSSETDTVVLHLGQAVRVVIDLAVSTYVRLGLGSPPTHSDAFRLLAGADMIDAGLAARLARAAGFRAVLVHAYASLDCAGCTRSPPTGRPTSGRSSPRYATTAAEATDAVQLSRDARSMPPSWQVRGSTGAHAAIG